MNSADVTLPLILANRALETPDSLAFRYLPGGRSDDAIDWSYAALAERAAIIAAEIRGRGLEGCRIMLALDPGMNYLAALFGILQVGATAVPSFPPSGKRALSRFVSIFEDCQPTLIVADARYRDNRGRIDAALDEVRREHPAEWLLIDDSDLDPADHRGLDLAPSPGVGDLPALLQYTSGSTGDPKGVMVTHANLVSNSVSLDRNMGHDPDRVGCSWLPPYHDMGLIGTIVLAVHSGWPLVLLSPMDFVQRPYRWLKAITDHQVTISVSPNFGLDLTAGTVTDEELETLDLSSLRQIYCGAEPILHTTLTRFRERFERCGYSESVLIPCYGMAEATLFISGKAAGTTYSTAVVERSALECGQVNLLEQPGAESVELVSCGQVAAEHEIRIVDPDTNLTQPDGTVGEIWVRGPNVTAGYFDRPEQTADTYRAVPLDEPSSSPSTGFLRTGDLGFVMADELYVTGRIKDLVIIAGRNLLPQDIELSVSTASDLIRSVACFSIPGEQGEQLVVVAEVRRAGRLTGAEVADLRGAVIEAVVTEHGVTPVDVHFGPTGTVQTTTSGKVQRHPTRAAYLDGALRSLSVADATLSLT